MSLVIASAHQSHLPSCLAILADSVLGTYFEPPLANQILQKGAKSKELFVALQGDHVVGFYLVETRGTFLVFPYLHLLAVKSSERGQGIGKILLSHFETAMLNLKGYPFRQKVFLLVSSANQDAVRFYQACGYQTMATIDDLFAGGDTEHFLMKDLGLKPSSPR